MRQPAKLSNILGIYYFSIFPFLHCFVSRNAKLRHINALTFSNFNSCTMSYNHLQMILFSSYLKLRMYINHVYILIRLSIGVVTRRAGGRLPIKAIKYVHFLLQLSKGPLSHAVKQSIRKQWEK